MTAMSTLIKSSTKRSQPGPKPKSSSSNNAPTPSMISRPPATAAAEEKEAAAYYVQHPHPHPHPSHRRSRSMSDFSTLTIATNKYVSSDECNPSSNDRVRRSTASWTSKLASKSTVQRAQAAANASHTTNPNGDRRGMQRMTTKGSESDTDHHNNNLHSNNYRLRRPRSAASASISSSTKTTLDRHKAMTESDADETSCYSSSSERSASSYCIPRTSRKLFGPELAPPSSSSSSSSTSASSSSHHQTYHRPRHTLRRSSSHHTLSRHPVTPSPPTDVSNRDTMDATLCEAMRTEIWKAVEEIRMELRQSIERTYPKVEALVAAASDSKDLTVPEVIADVRKEYAEKLGQSEERVQQLWSQLAVEERRCLEFAKIVQELVIPDDLSDQLADPASCTEILRDGSWVVVDKKQRQQEEEQAMSRSLNEEAHKYFEECVSIIPGLTGVDVHSPAVQGEKVRQTAGEQLLVQEASASTSPDKIRNRSVEHEDEGMVLPWLQWETEDNPVVLKDRPSSEEEFVETNHHYAPMRNGSSSNNRTCPNATATCTNVCANSSDSGSSSSSSNNITAFYQYEHVMNPHSYPTDLSPSSSSASSACADRMAGAHSSSRSTQIFEDVQFNSESSSPLEDLIWERLQFCSRIDSGHLILCETPFW